MDNDTLMSVGGYCEDLLQSPTFQFLASHFEQNAVNEMLASKPHENKSREYLYAKVQAHREFLQMILTFAQKKNEADNPTPPDHLDLIDDPNVHNIFEE